MIQVYHVYKGYGKTAPVLSDITFRIKKGGFVFLTGPSGAGKSTLLRLIFCDESADQGQLLVNGRNLLKIKNSEKSKLRRCMGIVFQDFNLLAKRSVYENIAFAQRVTGIPEKNIKKNVACVLKLVGLIHKRDSQILRLSGGEQQRVAIARAIVNEPLILIADEPTGNLDEDMAGKIMELFKNVNKRGATVLIATHNKKLIQNANNVIFLDKGKIVNSWVRGRRRTPNEQLNN